MGRNAHAAALLETAAKAAARLGDDPAARRLQRECAELAADGSSAPTAA
jgi:hypothetical protein